MPLADATVSALRAIVGDKYVLKPDQDLSAYNEDNRDLYQGQASLVVKPGSTHEVSQVCRLCYQQGLAMVPQSGNTGHQAGAIALNGEVVINVDRLKACRSLDAANNSAVVEAGMILEDLHRLADEADRLYPVSLAAKGSCRIGGNIGTNAGGTGVLAYGNTRENILGLEVVLPNGDIWDGLRALKKDNTGYDLKQLFIGAEGTLGIVTAAVVKLAPKPKGREVAFVGLDSPEQALALLNHLLSALGKSLTAFELMPKVLIDFTLDYMPSLRAPFADSYPWVALIEVSSGRSAQAARDDLEERLGEGLEQELALDAVLAENLGQQADFWSIRETAPTAQKKFGWSIKHDISVPVHRVPEFFQRAEPIVMAALPGARICGFGHMGDGNLHYNITQPIGASQEVFLPKRQEINEQVHALVMEMQGSISAEHGIGRTKADAMLTIKSPVELSVMKSVKQALDPKGLMNPGKVLPASLF